MAITGGELQFESYKEYLKYVYNSAHAAGRICEIVEMVENQPKNIPFDYEFNTVEGRKRDIISYCQIYYIGKIGKKF